MQAIKYLDSLAINLDTFWNTLWKHVLIVEIIKSRYKVDSADSKNNVLATIREKIKNDRTKQAALAYLDEYEGRFWCETDERIRDITDQFANRISAEAGGELGLGGVTAKAGASRDTEVSVVSTAQQVDRFQRVVNDTQLARLNKMITVLDENILASPHDFRYVVIDDLDREWVDERIANDLIRCLFATVYGLQYVRNLKVLVALRTNIFQELQFGRRGGGQEEKLRALVLDMRWTKEDIEDLLNERVRLTAGSTGLQATTLAELLPVANNTMGKPVEYLLDRTLMRPRDAIAFANECLAVGVGKRRLTWNDIKTAEFNYSAKRLLALRDEWDSTYGGISRVFEVFRRSPTRISKQEFQTMLDDIILLMAEPDYPGVRWLPPVLPAAASPLGGGEWGRDLPACRPRGGRRARGGGGLRHRAGQSPRTGTNRG